MNRRLSFLSVSVVSLVLVPMWAGCAAFECTVARTVYEGQDESGNVHVELYRRSHISGLDDSARSNYSLLTLRVKSGEDEEYYVVGRKDKELAHHPDFDFGELAGRMDKDRERFWIVDLKQGGVVTAVDRRAGRVTVYGASPPSWAGLEEGIPLTAVE